MSELPEGWAEATLQDLAAPEPNAMTDGPFGSKLKTIDYTTEGARVVRLGNIGVGTLLENNKSYISLKKFQTLRKHEVFAGDLVIAALAEPVGRCARIPADLGLAVVKADCVRLKTHPLVTTDYVMHAMNSPQGRTRAEGTAHGVGRLRINMGEMRELSVPIAPLNEQRRIVDKIEALTARSRRAKEALDAVPPLLDKLRQSILAAAFRGDLTKDWRANNPNVEPASVLLERIRQERRRRWEETTLAALKAKGKPPKDDTWKSKYQEPDPVDTEGLPELPEGWAWASVDELAIDGPSNGISPPSGADATGTPTLKLSATSTGRCILDQSTTKRTIEPLPADNQFWLQPGDLLVQRANSIDYVGVSAVFDGPPRTFVYPDLMMRLRFSSILDINYTWRAISWDRSRQYLRERATGTAGNMPKISGATLRSLPLPVAPADEMKTVTKIVDEVLAGLGNLRQHFGSQTQVLAELDASILSKAFRGELVPQDPNDEPASVLLGRIRAEREAPSTQPKTSNKRATKKRKAS